MPIMTDGPMLEPQNKGIDEFHAGRLESLGAAAAEAASDLPIVQLSNLGEMKGAKGETFTPETDAMGTALPTDGPSIAEAAKPATPRIDIIDANDRVKKAGLAPHLKLPDQPDIAPAQLEIMMSRAQARREREATIERGPQGFVQSSLSVGTSFLVGAVDPINIASAFIPVMGELRYAKLLAAAGEGFGARMAVRGAVGAAQGAVGQAALEPLDWWSHTQDGRDFGMSDVLHNVLFGAVLGGALHAGGGLISDAWRGRQERPLFPYDLGEPLESHTPWQDLRAKPPAAVPGLPEFAGIHEPLFPEAPGDRHVTPASVAAEAEAARPTIPSAEVQTINDLPQRAREDAARAGIAALIEGEPLRVGEMLTAAADTDPRIAESFEAHIRNEPLSAAGAREAVFDDVHQQLLTAGLSEDEAGYNAAIVAARYATRAERLGNGMTAADLYRAEGLQVRAGEFADTEGRAFQQRKGEAPNLFAEREAEGQTSLPGTGRIGQGELAQRRANEALKPKVAQKPMDEGLFGDSAAQKSFFQSQPTAPAFYSALGRAIDLTKQEKASSEQWLGILKNATSVKPEEMKWLGIEDWLKEQNGSVTKAQLQEFIRANQIEVKEVGKGGERPTQFTVSSAGGPLASSPEVMRFPTRELAQIEWDRRHAAAPNAFHSIAELPGETSRARYPSYVLPGGENYRELLLTLPRTVRDETPPSDVVAGKYKAEWDRLVAEHQRAAKDVVDASVRRLPPGEAEDRLNAVSRQLDALHDKMVDETVAQNPARHGDPYRSSHWEEPNILTHIRFDDRVSDGKKTLHVAEVQSDWHQAGKRKGYRGDQEAELKRLLTERDQHAPNSETYWALQREIDALGRGDVGVPNSPFKTSWPELAMKRMIRYAAEHDYDRISWDTGATNAERYDLSKQIKSVRWNEKTGDLQAKDHSGEVVLRRQATKEELPDIIGKEAAQKLVDQKPVEIKLLSPVLREYLTVEQTEHQYIVTNVDGRQVDIGKGTVGSEAEAKEYAERYLNTSAKEINQRRELEGERIGSHRTLEGLDLKVGGEGMAGFYDKILPATVNKLVKKFGAKVEQGKIGSPQDFQTSHFVGDEPSRSQIAQVAEAVHARPTDQRFVSPVTGERQMFQINRANNETALREVRQAMDGGASFAEAMSRHGTHDLAEVFGGKIEVRNNHEEKTEPVHAVDITPELRKAAIERGFPLFQGGEANPRGRITLGQNQAVIDLFKAADRSTFMHESGHLWLDELMRDAEHPQASEQLRGDREAVLQWLGVKSAAEIGTDQHEKWAEGFERYLSTGEAPSSALVRAFEAFKTWLLEIYRAVSNSQQPIPDAIRGVMDRLLATDREIAERADETNAVTKNVRKAPRGRAAADPATWSLFEYLASKGGLKPDPELHAIFGGKRGPMVGGFGPLLRHAGMTLDDALRSAKDAHYMFDPGDITGAEAKLTPRDLLDLLDQENRKHKIYRNDYVAPDRGINLDEERPHIVAALHDELEASTGQKGVHVDPALEDRVVEIIQKEGGTDVLAAYERAIMEDAERFEGLADERQNHPETHAIPGWDHPDAGAASRAGAADPRPRRQGRLSDQGAGGTDGGEPPNAGAGDRAQAQAQLARDAAWRRLSHPIAEVDEPQVIAASNAAAEVKRPPTKLDERLSAAQKAEAFANEMYDMFAERLPEQDRVRLDDLIKTIDSDHEAREIAISRGGACLFGARA